MVGSRGARSSLATSALFLAAFSSSMASFHAVSPNAAMSRDAGDDARFSHIIIISSSSRRSMKRSRSSILGIWAGSGRVLACGARMRLRGGEFSSMEGEFGSDGEGGGGGKQFGKEEEKGVLEEENGTESDDWLNQDIKKVGKCAKSGLVDSNSNDSREFEFEDGTPRTRDDMLEELREMIRADEEAERGFKGATFSNKPVPALFSTAAQSEAD